MTEKQKLPSLKNEKRYRPIDIALDLGKKQITVLSICITVPPLLIVFVLTCLFMFERMLYQGGVHWYSDPFTLIMVFIFVLGQAMACYQFIKYLKNMKKTVSLIKTISTGNELETIENLQTLAEQIRTNVPHSDHRSLVLNWLDYRGDSTAKRNENLENTTYIRMDLIKEKENYFHELMNRITLKLGFLGTLIGLMLTFPPMKRAMMALTDSGGEMTFITDICKAIDGDQFAILTTLLATMLSLFAEFLTIQMINRFALNHETLMSYLTDWYHTRVEPLFSQGATDSINKMENSFTRAEELLAQNMQVITQLARKNAEQLAALTDFNATIEKRVAELESYEIHYRNLVEIKGRAEEHLAGNIQVLTDVAQKTGEQLKGMVSSQEVIGTRVENLHRYEEQYRSLISTKDAAGVPRELRPNGGN